MNNLSNDLCISDKQILTSWPHSPEGITSQVLIDGAFADPLKVLSIGGESAITSSGWNLELFLLFAFPLFLFSSQTYLFDVLDPIAPTEGKDLYEGGKIW
jgi:hypothetical protein